jgi:hypothetical protein
MLRKRAKKESVRKDALQQLCMAAYKLARREADLTASDPSSSEQQHNEQEWKIIASQGEEALGSNLRTLAIHILRIDHLTFQIVR